jgi:hypothetical protein
MISVHRKARPFALAVLALAVAAGCQSGDGSRPTSTTRPAPAASGSPARTGTSADADTAFCALARAKGAANLNVFDGDSTTPEQERQVLANIDDLTTAAPAAIHPDFVRFDTVEHALLAENGTPDPALSQEAGGQELRDSLQNISDYLGQRCDIHA